MLSTLIYFFLSLFLLIIVHEYGHFIVARWMGVKVLRFSLGFGKVLASWRGKHGTEFVLSLIPLGGYIKMLDEAEGPVPSHQQHLAFNNKPIWARVAVVVAGPLFNFLFAFVALWLVLIIGIQSLAPIIGSVAKDSIASQAGLTANQEIVMMDGRAITSWRDFQYLLMMKLGTQQPINLIVKSLPTGIEKKVVISLTSWKLDAKKPDILASLGLQPFIPTVPPIIGEVVANSPSMHAGLREGDVITKINGKVVSDWLSLVDFVRKHPKKTVTLEISRHGEIKQFLVPIASEQRDGHLQGFLGLRSQQVNWPAHWLRLQRLPAMEAIGVAYAQTVELTKTSFVLIGRLVLGKLSLKTISGPVGIAQGAGESAKGGLVYYLSFLALVSISLGVLNLLPIPMLDGGHLLYYVVELVLRKPVSEEIRTIGSYLGLILLMALMMIALNNDITRLSGS